MLTLWLGHIRRNSVKESARPMLTRYKREAAKAILHHFIAKAATRKNSATNEVIPAAMTDRPVMPAPGAPFGEWADYYETLATLYRGMEAQRTIIALHQTRLDTHDEQIAGLSDDMMAVKEALTIMGEISATVTVSPQQAAEIQQLVGTIHEHTGVHRGTIFGVFKKQFNIPRYDELPAAQFESSIEWLRRWGRAQLPKKKL